MGDELDRAVAQVHERVRELERNAQELDAVCVYVQRVCATLPRPVVDGKTVGAVLDAQDAPRPRTRGKSGAP